MKLRSRTSARSRPRSRGDRVHRPFHRVHALRTAGAAVRGDDHRVGVEGVELDPVGAGLVRPEQLGRGDDRHDQPVRDVGAVVVPEPHRQPEQPAVVVEADLDVLLLAALVRRGDEVLAAVLGELHRPAQRAGRHRHQHLFRPRVHDLHPEAAADVRGDHLDAAQVQAELGRHRGPHPGRGLGRGPDPQPLRVGVPAGQHSPALQRHRRPTARRPGPAPAGAVRRRSPAAASPTSCTRCAATLPGTSGCTSCSAAPGRLDADHRRQRLVADHDPLGGVLGQVAVLGHHHHDRLADVVHLVAGQRVLGAAVGQRRVRDQQRQRVGQRAGQVLVGVDRQQARRPPARR